MSKYQLVSNAFIDGEVKDAGSVVELNDDTAAGLLERGTVVAYNGDNQVQGEAASAPAPLDLPASPSEPEAPAVAQPQPEAPTAQPTPEQLQKDFEQTGAVESSTPEAPSEQPPVQLN